MTAAKQRRHNVSFVLQQVQDERREWPATNSGQFLLKFFLKTRFYTIGNYVISRSGLKIDNRTKV